MHEDGPQNLPLAFGQPSPATEAGDITIGFPRVQLPCVDDLFPLWYEMLELLLLSRNDA